MRIFVRLCGQITLERNVRKILTPVGHRCVLSVFFNDKEELLSFSFDVEEAGIEYEFYRF
jgi:hypothetical protein